MTAATMVKATYGYNIESHDDDYIKLASNAIISVGSLGVVGLNPIDFFPICLFYMLSIAVGVTHKGS